MLLKKKNILITGAGKGIGLSSVNCFINNGAYVYALIRDRKDNRKFLNLKNLKIYNGDVNDLNLIKKILVDSKKNKKVINCLVNNAGIRFRKKFLYIKKNELLDVFNTNFFSIFSTMQLFSKFVITHKVKGSIVNLASIVGQTGFDELSAYAASKGALIALTKSFSTEMSKYGIRANTISPGFTKTSYYKNFKKNKTKLYNWTLTRIPLKRWATPEEISEIIAFILSNKSIYIQGENINIDGGWLSS